MVKNQTLKGEHSFRGLGFVRLDGLLLPVCGSRKFNFSVGTNVSYITAQIELAKPEEDRNAVIPVQVVMDSGTGAVEIFQRGDNSAENTVGRLLMKDDYTEGLPWGVKAGWADGDVCALIPPFRWQLPLYMEENPHNSAATDPRPDRRIMDQLSPIHAPGRFLPNAGYTFNSYIWIP